MKRMISPALLGALSLSCLALLLPAPAQAQGNDWLFFRGPAMNGSTPEKLTSTQLSDSDVIWRKELGKGSSSVTIKDGRAYTMGNVNNEDVVYCFDGKTGREIWKHSYPCKFEARMWEGGTAATPTLDEQHVYVFSYDGQLVCLKQSDGSEVWRKHMIKDYGGKLSQWKYSGSPVIIGSALLLDIGGSGNSTIALKKATGEKIWGAGDDKAGYAPVMPFQNGSDLQLLAFKGKAMLGLEARTGKELWRIPWKSSYDVNASSPIVVGSSVLITSGYPRTGRAELYNFDGGKPRQVWKNPDVITKMSSAAYKNGHFYAVTEKRGAIMCFDAKTGKTVWSERGGGNYGSPIIAGDHLIVQADNGILRIGDASPKGWNQHSELKVLEGRCWVQPSFADGLIYTRSNNGSLAVVKP